MDVMPRKKKSSSQKGESLFTVDRFNQLKTALMPLVGPGLLFAAIFCALALLTYDAAQKLNATPIAEGNRLLKQLHDSIWRPRRD